MQDYNNLIRTLHEEKFGDQDLIKVLQNNFVDEHLYTEWFRTKLLAMKQYEFSARHFSASTQSHFKNYKPACMKAEKSSRKGKAIHGEQTSYLH